MKIEALYSGTGYLIVKTKEEKLFGVGFCNWHNRAAIERKFKEIKFNFSEKIDEVACGSSHMLVRYTYFHLDLRLSLI